MESGETADRQQIYSQQNSAQQLQPGKDLVDYAKCYAREKPEVVALWCFGVGFILGWKLKPW